MRSTGIDPAIRPHFPGDERVFLLRIGAEQTAIAAGEAREPAHVLILPVGYGGLARQSLRHSPPTPLELENAIVIVEDEIAWLRGVNGSNARLVTRDALIREMARHAGLAESDSIVMSRDAVEQLFGRLASVAEGLPVSYAGMPVDAEFSAGLLILREFMHHLQFEEISVLAAGE